MRKIYSLLLMSVMAMGLAFHAKADVAVAADDSEGGDFITIKFNPKESGYVETKEYGGYDPDTYATIYVTKETYTVDENGEVKIPFDGSLSLQVNPNEGYGLIDMVGDSYDWPFTPYEGVIFQSMGRFGPNTVWTVNASKAGSFTLSGVGEKLAEAYMKHATNYSKTEITEDPQIINYEGGDKYSFGSNNWSAPDKLWKVEITREGNTEMLAETYAGSCEFEYMPQDGDVVVVYSDKPTTYAKINLSIDDEEFTSDIITQVYYKNEPIDAETWKSADWTVEAGYDLEVIFNKTGIANIYYDINNGEEDGSLWGTSKTFSIANNDPNNVKEYNIVFTVEKEKYYTVKIETENPEAFKVAKLGTYGSEEGFYDFNKSGDEIEVAGSTNTIRFKANNGWKIGSILVDGVAQTLSSNNDFTVTGDCTITVDAIDLDALRTNTVVVYLDESVDWSVASMYRKDYTQIALNKGYNMVKFADDEAPFSFSCYPQSSSMAYYMLNNNPMANQYECYVHDGDVVKIYNGAPTPVRVDYEVEDEVKDAVEVYHDYVTKVDHTTVGPNISYLGNIIHIKPVAPVARAASGAFKVAVNDESVTPDADGVYTIVVDGNKKIKISKDTPSGVADNFADGNELFDIYTIQGVVVKRNASNEDLNQLPAGIYVAGGKKVVVK